MGLLAGGGKGAAIGAGTAGAVQVEGWQRVILGRDVLLMEAATAKIVDLLRNVF